MIRASSLLLIFQLACSDDTDPHSCDLGSTVEIEAHAGALQTDGSVTVYGSVRFAPASETDNGAVSAEIAVYAVYVAGQEVQQAATDFNFRSWTVTLTADRLAAFTTTAEDGAKTATLPVRAILHGGCVAEIPELEQPKIEIPMTAP